MVVGVVVFGSLWPVQVNLLPSVTLMHPHLHCTDLHFVDSCPNAWQSHGNPNSKQLYLVDEQTMQYRPQIGTSVRADKLGSYE